MTDVAAALMVGLSAASLCFVAAQDPRLLSKSFLLGATMLIAMAATCIPGPPVWVTLVAVVFLLTTVPVALARPPHVVTAPPMQIHRALSAILMAILLLWHIATTATYPEDTPAQPVHMSGMTGMSGMSGVDLPGSEDYIKLALLGAYLLTSTGILARHLAHLPPIRRLSRSWYRSLVLGEMMSMGAALACMAIM